MKESGIAAGTLYPLLDRLSDDGWLETRWEESPMSGRPARRMFRLTRAGRAGARAALADLSGERAIALGIKGV